MASSSLSPCLDLKFQREGAVSYLSLDLQHLAQGRAQVDVNSADELDGQMGRMDGGKSSPVLLQAGSFCFRAVQSGDGSWV